MKPAWEQEIVTSQACSPNPRDQYFPRLLGDFKLHRSLSFLLHHDRAGSDAISMHDIAHAQFDQIARTQLAVHGKIEQCQSAGPIAELQTDSDGPDVLET